LPNIINGKTQFDCPPSVFAEEMKRVLGEGASVLGGCCGTTPMHIRELARLAGAEAGEGKAYSEAREFQNKTFVSSRENALQIKKLPLIIGERINPTGKAKLKEALRAGDMEYLAREAVRQLNANADLIDINVGLPGTDEAELLKLAVETVQNAVACPLQLDSANPKALERAIRVYCGKPLINSVNGKRESMDAAFPLVKKYGGVLVCLCLDEEGIPETAWGRVEIARKIIAEAKKYGIAKTELVFDPLTLPVAVNPKNEEITLEALRLLSDEGLHTVLGITNISFGLPNRAEVNEAFLKKAIENGLTMAIINPINEAEVRVVQVEARTSADTLKKAVEYGLPKLAAELCGVELNSRDPMSVIEQDILPALDSVGKGFENKTVFLPQLLLCAQAAGAALSLAQDALKKSGAEQNKGSVVLATVEGDIHDIGKNIAAVLLENYGFTVVDLGKNVSPQAVLAAVERHNAPLCGLSALMTTTVPAMEQTVALLKQNASLCKIMVGGAVLDEALAERMGADFYAKDAMAGVRYANISMAKEKRE
jgi:5-methyltetrahydrofolate--homocysteine methyltransferase